MMRKEFGQLREQLFRSNEAQDDQSTCLGPHQFRKESYKKPTKCGLCDKLLIGLMNQGLKCQRCGLNVHRNCIEAAQLEKSCVKVAGSESGQNESLTQVGAARQDTPRQENPESIAQMQDPLPNTTDESASHETDQPAIKNEEKQIIHATIRQQVNTVDQGDEFFVQNDSGAHEGGEEAQSDASSVYSDDDDDDGGGGDDAETDVFLSQQERPTPFGTLRVQVVDSAQVQLEKGNASPSNTEQAKPVLVSPLRVSGYCIGFGGSYHHFPDQVDHSFPSQRQGASNETLASPRSPTENVWDFSKVCEFPIYDVCADVQVVVHRQNLLSRKRKPFGQIVVPLQAILLAGSGDDHCGESEDKWYELFPIAKGDSRGKYRPAIPTASMSGIDFPPKSLGLVCLRISFELTCDAKNIWQMYFRPLDPVARASLSKRSLKKRTIKGTLDAVKETHRNFTRIGLVKRYFAKHIFSSGWIQDIREWRDPARSVAFLLTMAYLVLFATLWQIPLVLYLFLICLSVFRLRESGRMQMNWEMIDPPKALPTKRLSPTRQAAAAAMALGSTSVEGAKQRVSAASAAVRQRLGNMMAKRKECTSDIGQASEVDAWLRFDEEEQDADLDLGAIYRSRSPDDTQLFHRTHPCTDFMIWNQQIRDPNRGATIFQKGTDAMREVLWVELISSKIATQGEKMIALACGADASASFAMNIQLLVGVLSVSGACLVYSYAPMFWRSCGLFVLALWTSPPLVRAYLDSLRVKLVSLFPKHIIDQILDFLLPPESYFTWDAIQSVWGRIPNLEEVGHRQIAATQQVEPINTSKKSSVARQPSLVAVRSNVFASSSASVANLRAAAGTGFSQMRQRIFTNKGDKKDGV